MQKVALAAIVLLSAAGCAGPRNAPLEREVLAEANDPQADFLVQPVTRADLARIAEWPGSGGGPVSDWPGGGVLAGQHIARGDRISLTIWDSSENSLMAAGGQKSVPLTEMEVDPEGKVFVPYLDRVEVAGKTPEAVRQDIQARLGQLLPAPQVQLTVTPGRKSAVDLVGGVRQPGSYPLGAEGLTVLSLLSLGGGAAEGLKNPQVRLMRGDSRYAVPLSTLYDDPRADMALRGGDKVILAEDSRYFLSLGAAGNQAMHPFPRDHLSALDAISVMGGVNGGAGGDPRGILVLRDYGAEAGHRGAPAKPWVVFTLDLTGADGLFAARNFPIRSGDVVLVTEHPVTQLRNIMSIFQSGVRLAGSAQAL